MNSPAPFSTALDARYPTRFADLGIPFPLFEAPIVENAMYIGVGGCSICGEQEVHCFWLQDVVLKCKACGAQSARDAKSCETVWQCPRCETTNVCS